MIKKYVLEEVTSLYQCAVDSVQGGLHHIPTEGGTLTATAMAKCARNKNKQRTQNKKCYPRRRGHIGVR